MKHGDKRDYPKIDIYVDGTYDGSTTWCKTCKEAVQRYRDKFGEYESKVKANFSKL